MSNTIFDPLEGGNLTNSHYWRDYLSSNHVMIERLVPELLGELDNATEMQAQMAYVLACLRKLARDEAILKHEFDSVVDGLLATINKILAEFSNEITTEINNIWDQLKLLHNTEVLSGNDISVTSVTVDGDVSDVQYTVNSLVDVVQDDGISVTKTNSTYTIKNLQTVASGSDIEVDKSGNTFTVNSLLTFVNGTDINVTKTGSAVTINNIQTVVGGSDVQVTKSGSTYTVNSLITFVNGTHTQVTKSGSAYTINNLLTFTGTNGITASVSGDVVTLASPFLLQLYNQLVASGAYSGAMGTGSFNGNLAYGNINLFGGATDGSSYIRTSTNATENDLAGGIVS